MPPARALRRRRARPNAHARRGPPVGLSREKPTLDRVADTVLENLARVRRRVADACSRAGRSPDQVRIVAVTKYAPAEAVRALIDAGVSDFAESRVQQLQRRAQEFGASLLGLDERGTRPTWHLVGHLQRNKVRPWLDASRVLHSLDSERLAGEIEARAAALGAMVDVFLEVNVSGERTKGGVAPHDAPALADRVRALPHLRLRGLMAMAPLTPSAGDARPAFRALRELLESLRAGGVVPRECGGLSMGMSHDFEVAIEEGATVVRVGSSLFEGLPAVQPSAADTGS